jgi:hypothetical protein
MKEFNFIRTKFLERHQEIDSNEYLDKYINFLINYNPPESEKFQYFEKHHILPKSAFPEYKDEDWNITELEYGDHRLVHLWLFKSINTRQYQRPLNWMLNQYKNKEEISRAAKRGWIKFKSDEDRYNNWRKEKSDNMKKYVRSEKYKNIMINYHESRRSSKSDEIPIKRNYKPKPYVKAQKRNYVRNEEFIKTHFSSEKQRERSNIFWNNITDEEYILFCKKMKSYWTEEKKLEKSNQMIEYYKNNDNILKKSIETKERWNSMDKEKREEFNYKMNAVNKNEEKRKVAGDKIRNLWLDDEYLEKMRNRKLRGGRSILIIKPDGEEIIVNTIRDMEKIYNFSSYLVRKYIDTGTSISEMDLKIGDKLLLNCKIKTLENG